ncbi:FUSC family membrane protein [Zunongwangia sp.]|uniref:FUSC family membrane protein n=1 Tax=Zunongwangia sp. TaxID=1965325 RepID=UPI003AA88268
MIEPIPKYSNAIFRFLRSTEFIKALLLSLGGASAIAIFNAFNLASIGIPLAVGCLLVSPSNVTGTTKHKVLGILTASVIAGITSTILGYAQASIYILLPVMVIMVFCISYLAVYGFRASMVTFAGLMAVVLSFANVNSEMPIWVHSLLITAGGIWYLCLSLLWHWIRPKHETEQLLAECIELTGDYLQTRANLLVYPKQREQLQDHLFKLTDDLNQKHEVLREVLISSRKLSGNSGYSRKRLLIFIELVDILELGMANPVNYKQMEAFLNHDKSNLQVFGGLSFELGQQLKAMSASIETKKRVSNLNLTQKLKKAREIINKFQQEQTEHSEYGYTLQNLLDYQEEQYQKITTIFNVIHNIKNENRLFMKPDEAVKFITPQDYSFKILRENFNFDSLIFRHALRLTLIVLIGFSLGSIFSIQNAYWILLTVVVIMRPNYGLTKSRTKERIIGTIIGGIIAIGVVFLTQNTTIYGILGIFSLTMAFALIQKNYTVAATFITLSIIFIYALLKPNVISVIEYRILDTMLGAGLAALGNLVLWPAWESNNIRETINISITANREFFKEIVNFYTKKEELPLSYKLSRKKSFLKMGNLSAAFQRMTQEPKSKQKDVGLTYRMVSLNQTFLSALASMGTYIRNHNTTEASENFKIFTEQICHNLVNAEEGLQQLSKQKKADGASLDMARTNFNEHYQELLKNKQQNNSDENKYIHPELQEAQLIMNQLQWLLDISKNIRKTAYKMHEN